MMGYMVWIIAGAISALLLLLVGVAHRAAKTANVMSNYTMTLLLDEFAYQRDRLALIQKIETTDSNDPFVIYHAVMFQLENSAEHAAVRKTAITDRVAKIRQSALNGRSLLAPAAATDGMPEAGAKLAPPNGSIGGILPNRPIPEFRTWEAQPLSVGSLAIMAGVVRRITHLKRKLLSMLGL